MWGGVLWCMVGCWCVVWYVMDMTYGFVVYGGMLVRGVVCDGYDIWVCGVWWDVDAWRGVVCGGMLVRGVAWCDVWWDVGAWCGVVWCGVWCDVGAWRGVVWCDVWWDVGAWRGVVWRGVMCGGMLVRGVAWCGVMGGVWCGTWCVLGYDIWVAVYGGMLVRQAWCGM